MIRKLAEFKKPLPTPLPEGRFRYTRYLAAETGQTMLAEMFPPFEELDLAAPQDYPNLHLVDRGYEYDRTGAQGIIVVVYETLTDQYEKEKADVIDYDLNGLRRLTRELIALPGSPETFTVDESVFSEAGQPDLYLAQKKSITSDGSTRLVLTYLQPGVLVKGYSAGPQALPGSVEHTWETWRLDATSATDMGGAGNIIPGGAAALVAQQDTNVEGYPTRSFTTLVDGDGNSLVGSTLADYNDLKNVRNPGTLRVLSKVFTGGEIPYLESKPPTQGLVPIRIVVTLEAAPPVIAKPTAYNLDDLAVDILAITRARRYGGSLSTNSSETSVVTVTLYAESARIDQDSRSGYIYIDTIHNGVEKAFSYDAGLERSEDGSIVSTLPNTEYAEITLSGSDYYPAPTSGDLIDTQIDAISLFASGVVLYRVTRILVP